MKVLRVISFSLVVSLISMVAHADEMSSESELLQALNTYTHEQLVDMRGVTHRRASSIVLYRSVNQTIGNLSDLDGLPGFKSNPFYTLIEHANRDEGLELVALNSEH